MERLRGITQVDSISQWFIWISAERFCIDTIPVQAIRFLFPWYDLEHLYKPRKGQRVPFFFLSLFSSIHALSTNVTRCFQLGKAIYWSSFEMNRTNFSSWSFHFLHYILTYEASYDLIVQFENRRIKLFQNFQNSLELSTS